ncbi:UDP-N-acetylmuramate--L-alanine ligase [Paenimyroides tangerinum]|uniref:UDP-N-acetylmuramate--L-alanine ligase n=1 Tax=Paenimyroides tangerinum TaxID=2488728 RepID=A0A3P3WE34_9FLAO|nr:UDP-N-acetylmuramate--L-alanine ligase [Paenimyroides tangerinum]RRJ91889.1 UDP-N-acetylmuramate--L-alanine ligase [Paenimyroides tangerinum]
MNIATLKNVFFIGIGGIGMSAIARYFHRLGKNVAGYDKTRTHLTDELEAEGIAIHFEDNLELISKAFFDKEETLVVITPAIPKNHSEWNYFIDNNFEIKKRAEVLGLITENSFCFAVSGTHGKTTTSSMLAHILFQNKVDVTSFLGGVLENYNSNLVGEGKTVTVVEADEFDRSFLHLHPNIACVISNDADHLDIYGTNDEIKKSFQEFADKVSDKENLFVADHVAIEGTKVGINSDTNIVAENLKIENGMRVFDLRFEGETIKDIHLQMPGEHNVLNASLAISMARKYGLTAKQIKDALATFSGVRRRFSFKVRNEDCVYIDDYAHHPTEINAVYDAVRELYPNKKIVAVFQPHLFSRTNDFMDDFATSLSKFDEIYLLDIYPARELPMEGVTSQVLLDKMKNENKFLISKEQLIQFVSETNEEVLVTIGAGDIGEMVDEIKEILENRLK